MRDTGCDDLSVKLNDPSFATPIYASLMEIDGTPGSDSLTGLLPPRPSCGAHFMPEQG